MLNEAPERKGIALIVLTSAGLHLALRLQRELENQTTLYGNQRVYQNKSALCPDREILYFAQLKPLLAELWPQVEQFILLFALGSAVRLIAPLLSDKKHDPGVVVIDDTGQFAISVVSGHLGGANSLAVRCASILRALPVITTASEARGIPALDLMARTNHWQIEAGSALTAVTASLVNGEPVAVLQEPESIGWNENKHPWPANLIPISHLCEATPALFAALLVISDRLLEPLSDEIPTAIYRPPSLVLGVGCRRSVPFAELDTWIKSTLSMHQIAFSSVDTLATADIKADEEGLQQLASHNGWNFETHPVEQLKEVTAIARPSERVQQLIGTPSVSEAAALLSSRGGTLLLPKHKGKGMTVAVARKPSFFYQEGNNQ